MRILIILLCLATPAAAQKLEFFQGPVISSGRVIGMGGAYIAVAEGADGHMINPVAFALRPRHALDSHFDWDLSISMLRLAGDEMDIDQSGQRGSFDRGTYAQLGGNLKFGRHGFGLQGAMQDYELSVAISELRQEDILYKQSLTTLAYAYAFLDGTLTMGIALSGVTARLRSQDVTEIEEVKVSGMGVLLGALWAPPLQPYHFGATVRSHTLGDKLEGRTDLTTLKPPETITAPWQVGLGGAYMFGSRLFNPTPSFGEGERPHRSAALPYTLCAVDVILTGPSESGTVGTQGYLRGRTQSVGQRATLGLRAGVESELLSWLRVRGGSYFEPSRFEATGRVHTTLGFDLRVPLWQVWKLNAALDLAEGYSNGGVGLGFWH